MKIFNPGEIIFNTFEVIELLNAGGMGNVYKVKHLKIPFIFALKQLKLSFKETKDIMIQSFISEISILRSLKHPNISKFYDSFYFNGNFFYVMEFIEGKDIKSYFRDLRNIEEEKILKYFHMCLNAIGYLHSRNIIHRDIKPSNIMIDFTQDMVKIIDFGISNFFGRNIAFVSPGYSPPEQYQNLPQKPYNDIFSLGITFLEIVTGIKPKEHNIHFNEDLHNEFITTVKDLAKEKISQKFLNILLRCVEINPQNRFQTINDIVVELIRNNFKIDNTYLTNFNEFIKKVENVFNQIEDNFSSIFANMEYVVQKNVDFMNVKIFDTNEYNLFFIFKENKLMIYFVPFLGKGILIKEMDIDNIDKKEITESLKNYVKL